ncbi:hypothetical protein [Virgibacillus pantothenticus]|uniref:Uncharacterized protein n=1 Tax=Virgibacillus pantothenticus TaxID=1473 RepID=A0A0L0QM71_VIRPA|nr:hypothetical protein [Virgibacillus pantothenticus]KNE19692.1 hypothetical protein AFK71_14685 [Virgibacillus pantothenticus]MED3735872.1 hypothetical protein [Virgibacillus pantothenticus]QTY14775.1 hypothetical protein KBP50_12605 [Virgibacillus pantothenticus]SIT15193.1 hypothetical protein SAMN05421787_12318 [Virgibacillus pantothenticus]
MVVRVPKEVAEAFDYFKRVCPNEDIRNLTFMAIPYSAIKGKGAVLKEFAQSYPTDYIKAISNGYLPIVDVQKEVEDMINEWLEKPYVDGEKKDIERFAAMITNYFQVQK